MPIALAFIDYRARVVGMSECLVPTGNWEADLARIRAACAGKVGKRPEKGGVIRFVEPRV